MRIAVLGAGGVGSTLAAAWQRAGLDVAVGVREPGAGRYDALRGDLPITNVARALDGAEVAVIAIPGTNLHDLLALHHEGLDSKIVIDTTNRMDRSVLHQVPALEYRLPHASIFRGFCSLGYEIFADPMVGRELADLLFIGPLGPHRAVVESLIREVGMRPVWIGGLDAADALDGAAQLWFSLVAGRGLGRRVALRVISDTPIP